MSELFPILGDEELLHVDGTEELIVLKKQYPDPVEPGEARHPMAMYRVMLASRRAVAQAERRHLLEMILTQVAEADPLHEYLGAALREAGAE